jgi:hypothetical protein
MRPGDGKIIINRHRTARSPEECSVCVPAHLRRLPYGGKIIFRATPIWGMSVQRRFKKETKNEYQLLLY